MPGPSGPCTTPPPPDNRFTGPPFTYQIDPQHGDNPIEAAEQTKLNLPSRRVKSPNYFLFVPAGTKVAASEKLAAGGKLTVRVSLLFAVVDQINRAGLRTFFEDSDDAVLITVPGRESSKTQAAWGIGIDDAQIKSLLQNAGLDVNYDVEVISAYSTGYRGMQGTVLENATHKLLPLTQVKRIIYYDCLYDASGQPPSGYPVGQRTADAVKSILTANPTAKLFIYEVTDSGTKRYSGSLALNVPGQVVINLKPLGMELTTLQYARLLDEALRDGLIADADVPASVKALFPLPDRGSLSSDQRFIVPSVPAPGTSAKQLLKTWAQNNTAAIKKVQPDLAQIDQVIYDNYLMGWHPPNVAALRADARHDQFMPEFAWELLPP